MSYVIVGCQWTHWLSYLWGSGAQGGCYVILGTKMLPTAEACWEDDEALQKESNNHSTNSLNNH